MGVYDEYGYLGIQIKMNADGKRYRLGDTTPLSSGLYFSHEGVAVIDGFELVAVYPYDKMWDKWGGWIGEEAKAIVTEGNPVKAALDAIEMPVPECTCGPSEHELPRCIATAHNEPDSEKWGELKMKEERGMEMEPYWMVHRPGPDGRSPNFRHATFESAAKEAMRLARKELTLFVVLEAVVSYQPSREQEPISLDVERIGLGPDEVLAHIAAQGGDDCCEREGCNCDKGHPGPCPPEEGCSCDDAHDEPEGSTPIEVGDVFSRCSCYWCDPENHDPETCEFPSCGCKALAHINSFEFLTDLLEEAYRRWPSDTLDALPHEILERLIPKADCPCGCGDDDCMPGIEAPRFVRCTEGMRAELPYEGWTVADFEEALGKNEQEQVELYAGLASCLDLETHDCGGQPEGAHWCPHCGEDLKVERPAESFSPDNGLNEYVKSCDCMACLKMRAAAIAGLSLEGVPVCVERPWVRT